MGNTSNTGRNWSTTCYSIWGIYLIFSFSSCFMVFSGCFLVNKYENCQIFFDEFWVGTVCCPVSGRYQFPAKKGKLGYFRCDFNSSSTEAIRRKSEHLRYQLMVLAGFLVEKRENRRDFVQVSKILPANFWPFHCTAKLPYVNK